MTNQPDGWLYPVTLLYPGKVAGPNHATKIIQRLFFNTDAPAAGLYPYDSVSIEELEHTTAILVTIERPDHEADYCNTVYEDGHDPDDDQAAMAQLQAELEGSIRSSDAPQRTSVTVDGRNPIKEG